MIQGPCKQNQRSLVNSKIIDSSREYISGFSTLGEIAHLGFEDEDALDEIGNFKQSIITLLTSLLEGEIDMEIIQRMGQSLDFNMMKDRMLTIFHRFAQKLLGDENISVKDITLPKLDKLLQKESFDGSIAEAFEIFILIHSLADNLKEADENL